MRVVCSSPHVDVRRGKYVYGEGWSPYLISLGKVRRSTTVSQTYEKRAAHALIASQSRHAGARSEYPNMGVHHR